MLEYQEDSDLMPLELVTPLFRVLSANWKIMARAIASEMLLILSHFVLALLAA